MDALAKVSVISLLLIVAGVGVFFFGGDYGHGIGAGLTGLGGTILGFLVWLFVEANQSGGPPPPPPISQHVSPKSQAEPFSDVRFAIDGGMGFQHSIVDDDKKKQSVAAASSPPPPPPPPDRWMVLMA